MKVVSYRAIVALPAGVLATICSPLAVFCSRATKHSILKQQQMLEARSQVGQIKRSTQQQASYGSVPTPATVTTNPTSVVTCIAIETRRFSRAVSENTIGPYEEGLASTSARLIAPISSHGFEGPTYPVHCMHARIPRRLCKRCSHLKADLDASFCYQLIRSDQSSLLELQSVSVVQ